MAAMTLRAGLLAGIGGIALGATPAAADTLRDALASAYATNPQLNSARANQRANDENVPIKRADGLPSVTTQTSYSEFIKKSTISYSSPSRALQVQAQLGVPIYSGGGVRNSVRAAETRVEAGQASLRGTESSVFSQVVAAYMDVILDEAVVSLNRNQVDVLGVNLQATGDRFKIGDLTRTDVAQSQSRLDLAKGDTRTAEANLVSARENYIQLVGNPPGQLEPPPPLPGLPASPEEAVSVALENNPDVLAARQQAKASRFDVAAAGASRLPQVSLVAQSAYQNYFDTLGGIPGFTFPQSDKTAQVGASISIPLYQGGKPAAQVRQAQDRESAALEDEIGAERSVIAQTRAAYSSWKASLDVITSAQSAVDAASLSLEGVKAENSVGNRTILDILNAQQELLNARVKLVTARRNAYVAGFSLLAAMGKAEARDLGLDGGTLYDPETNYERVRSKWFDWDDDRAPKAKATRTVDTPAQGSEVHAK